MLSFSGTSNIQSINQSLLLLLYVVLLTEELRKQLALGIRFSNINLFPIFLLDCIYKLAIYVQEIQAVRIYTVKSLPQFHQKDNIVTYVEGHDTTYRGTNIFQFHRIR